MEERTTEDIDGLAEFITVRQQQTGAARASEAETPPAASEPQAAATAPMPAPASAQESSSAQAPKLVNAEAAVAAAAGQLRHFVLDDAMDAPTAGSSGIEEALRQLSSATRSPAGRQAAVRAGVADRCISLLVTLTQRITDARIVADHAASVSPLLPLVLKSLRNLCAGSRATQELLWKREAPAAALALAQRLIEPLETGVPAWLIGSSAEAVECACLAVQLIGNSAAGHEQTSTAAWSLLFPNGFRALLRPPLRAGLRKTPLPSLVSCVVMVIQTCLAKSAQQAAHRQELASSTAGAEVVIQLMQHLVEANKDAMLVEDEQPGAARSQRHNSTSTDPTDQGQRQIDPQAYQWIGLVVQGQCAGELGEATFEQLCKVTPAEPESEPAPRPVDDTVTWATLANPAQLRWLEVVSACLTTADAAQPDARARLAACSTADFLVRRLLPAALLDRPTDAEGLFAANTPVSALEAVYVAVHTLGVLLASYCDDGDEARAQHRENGWRLVSDERMVQLAARATVLLGVSGPPPVPPSESTAETDKGKVLPRGFKSQLLKLIGNAAFRHRDAQNAVHDKGGTAMAAAHTMVDEHNPYCREWVGIAVAPSFLAHADHFEPSADSVEWESQQSECWVLGVCLARVSTRRGYLLCATYARATSPFNSSWQACKRKAQPRNLSTTKSCRDWGWKFQWTVASQRWSRRRATRISHKSFVVTIRMF